jgi:hypothetical protein
VRSKAPCSRPYKLGHVQCCHPPSTGAVAVGITPAMTCLHSPATQAPGRLPFTHLAPSGVACSPAHRPVDLMHVPAPHTLASSVQLACTAARKHFCGTQTPVVFMGDLSLPSPQMRQKLRSSLGTCSSDTTKMCVDEMAMHVMTCRAAIRRKAGLAPCTQANACYESVSAAL